MKKTFLIILLLTTMLSLNMIMAQGNFGKKQGKGRNNTFNRQYYNLSKLPKITITGKVIADYNSRRIIYLLDTNSDGKGDYVLNYWYNYGKNSNIKNLPKNGDNITIQGYIAKRRYKRNYSNIDSVVIINNNVTQ